MAAVETAVVTGAGRGLGRAIASRLADRGLVVLVADVDAELAERAAQEIGRGATPEQVDVRDPNALRSIARRATARGRMAVWVNNAGVLRTEHVWDHTDDAVDLIVATNLLGVVHGSRAAVDAMRGGGGGRILNIASLSSLAPAPGLAVYGATKQGVLAFSIALQAELRETGIPIEVRSVCPDAIETDMVRERAGDPQAALIWSGMRRLLSVDEVADRAIELLDGDRLCGAIPSWRGGLARAINFAPSAGIRLTPMLKRLGDRRRRRWRAA